MHEALHELDEDRARAAVLEAILADALENEAIRCAIVRPGQFNARSMSGVLRNLICPKRLARLLAEHAEHKRRRG